MKIRIFALLIVLFSANVTQAQFEMGLKAGISSYQLGNKPIAQWIGEEKFVSNFTTAEYGHHFGLYTRARIAALFIEPSVLFQSGSFSHTFEEYSEAGVITVVKNETYQQINIPLLIGLKAGFFRLQAGPVGNFTINRTSDLWDFEDYKNKFKKSTYGYQLGAGLDIWRFRIDVNYENSLKELGEEITIGNQTFLINQNPARLIFSLGYKF